MKQLKCKVVMLPSLKQEGSKITSYRGLVYNPQSVFVTDGIAQHLYLVSDREIKNEDWVYDNYALEQSTWKVKRGDIANRCNLKGCKKIEATTDPSLKLPLISDAFVQKYVQKQGKINEVLIEMEVIIKTSGTNEFDFYEHDEEVVRVRNGKYCVIHKMRDIYTREEVVELFMKLCDCKGLSRDEVKEWLLENS